MFTGSSYRFIICSVTPFFPPPHFIFTYFVSLSLKTLSFPSQMQELECFQMPWMEDHSPAPLPHAKTLLPLFPLPLCVVWWDSSAVWAECLSRIWPQQCGCSADLCFLTLIASSCESYVKCGAISFFPSPADHVESRLERVCVKMPVNAVILCVCVEMRRWQTVSVPSACRVPAIYDAVS